MKIIIGDINSNFLQEKKFKIMKSQKIFIYYIHLNTQICNDDVMITQMNSDNRTYVF